MTVSSATATDNVDDDALMIHNSATAINDRHDVDPMAQGSAIANDDHGDEDDGGGVSVDVMEVNTIIQRSLRCDPETAEQSLSRCPKDRRIVDALTVVAKEW